jgi:hypothetical protein
MQYELILGEDAEALSMRVDSAIVPGIEKAHQMDSKASHAAPNIEHFVAGKKPSVDQMFESISTQNPWAAINTVM